MTKPVQHHHTSPARPRACNTRRHRRRMSAATSPAGAIHTVSLQVSSWNVLADCYCHAENYPYTASTSLAWPHRLSLIVKELATANSDILCLQEVDDYRSLQSVLASSGYDSRFARRGATNTVTGTNTVHALGLNEAVHKRDGLCVAWRSSDWARCEDDVVIDLNTLALAAPVGLHTRYWRHNNALIVRLRSLTCADLPPITIVNTHLYWSPLHSDVKMKQLGLIIKHLQSLTYASASANPIVFAGDFNSTPQSQIYRWLTRAEIEHSPNDSTLTHSSEPRFLLERGLFRLAKWLRSIGIDTEYYSEDSTTKRQCEQLFAKATGERRVIVTRSKVLIQRRNCPPFYLLPSTASWEEMFAALIGHFDLELIPSKFYSRCALCNGEFETITNIQAATDIEAPRDMPLRVYEQQVDDSGNPLEFFRCLSCRQVYWWGSKSRGAAEKFRTMFERITHKKEDEKENDREEASSASDGSDTNTTTNATSSSSHDALSLKFATELMNSSIEALSAHSPIHFHSAYAESAKQQRNAAPVSLSSSASNDSLSNGSNGNGDTDGDDDSVRPSMKCSYEPEFTNFTANFVDCIDYIFFTPNTSAFTNQLDTDNSAEWTVSIEAVRPMPSREELSERIGLPSDDWPSDHLRLEVRLRLDYHPRSQPPPPSMIDANTV